jgi:uncharacterized protein
VKPKTNDEYILEDSIFRVGKVIAVEGRAIKITVDKAKNSTNLLYKGGIIKNVSVGGYLKIVKGFTSIIGKVEGEIITEDKYFGNKTYTSEKNKVYRILNVSLLGFIDGAEFQRGIKELPLIDNECFLLSQEEFNQVHHFVESGDKPLLIGKLSLEKGQEIELGINSLFASHIGIFGNTGSGKSYTLGKLYHSLFNLFKDNKKFQQNSSFVFIDFNGEYIQPDLLPAEDNIIVEGKYKDRYILSTRTDEGQDKYPFTSKEINDPTFWSVILQATEKTQQPFIKRVLGSSFLSEVVSDVPQLKVHIGNVLHNVITKNDRNLEKGVITGFINELRTLFDEAGPNGFGSIYQDYVRRLQFHTQSLCYFYERPTPPGGDIYSNNDGEEFERVVIREKIDAADIPLSSLNQFQLTRLKFILLYYEEIFKGFSNREHLAPLMKRLEDRAKDMSKVIQIVPETPVTKNIEIVSLKNVNLDMRKLIPMLICKKKYDAHKSKPAGTMMNLIIDEAHNILSQNSERESEQWKDYRLETFEEIIKEGRKFGAFLTIASQRPYDISATIISQLHNYFLHRLINDNDIKAIEKTVSYLDKVSFDSMPILPKGTCIFAGLSAQVPVVLEVDEIPDGFVPISQTMTLVDKWE